MFTDFKKTSYLSLFFIAESFIILLNVSLSKDHKMQSSLQIIVAALGALYSNANSPKDSPDVYSFRRLVSSFLNYIMHIKKKY